MCTLRYTYVCTNGINQFNKFCSLNDKFRIKMEMIYHFIFSSTIFMTNKLAVWVLHVECHSYTDLPIFFILTALSETTAFASFSYKFLALVTDLFTIFVNFSPISASPLISYASTNWLGPLVQWIIVTNVFVITNKLKFFYPSINMKDLAKLTNAHWFGISL